MVIIDTHLIPCAELQFMDNAIEDDFTKSVFRNFQRFLALQTLIMDRSDKIFAA